MTSSVAATLRHLRIVADERERRAADLDLAARVTVVKDYQHRRFAKTYADLLQHPRFTKAAAFFLDDLYGPHDFSERDAQFARFHEDVAPCRARRTGVHSYLRTVSGLYLVHARNRR